MAQSEPREGHHPVPFHSVEGQETGSLVGMMLLSRFFLHPVEVLVLPVKPVVSEVYFRMGRGISST